MYRDMTRGSITPGAAAVCPAHGSGGPVWRWPMRWRGRWASTASGPLSLSAGFWRTPWDTATTSSGAERCSLGRETADSRNQKERCVTYELHPICWTVWYTVQQMGCVYMPKGIPQNQIKTKRPEPCAVQDPDRSGRLFLFCLTFGGHFRAGAALLLFYFFRASHYTSLRDAFLPLPHRACAAAFAAPGSAWPYQWALPHDRPCLPPAPVDDPRQRRWP